MKFHHIGVPTTQEKNWLKYLDGAKVHVSDPDADEFKIEWLKFGEGSPMPQSVQKQPHIAYLVDDLEKAIAGKNVVVPPFEASPTLKCAFIEIDGFAIELMQEVGAKPCCCGCGG